MPFFSTFQKAFNAPAFPHTFNKQLRKLALYSQTVSLRCCLGKSTPGTCPDLLTRGGDLQMEAKQGKAMDNSFHFLLQVVIMFRKQKN